MAPRRVREDASADAEIYRLTTENRRMVADVLESLDDDAWDRPTLCTGWTVREMAAHLVQPMLIGFGRFFVAAIRHRGDTDRTVDHFARRLARRSRTELISLLRDRAAYQANPRRVGPFGPFAETCIHLRDIARPLGLDADVPVGHWRILLDYLTSPAAVSALVPAGRLDGLHLRAVDTDWESGSGAGVSGPIEAIAMAATGRASALTDLHGPGVDVLAARLPACQRRPPRGE
jgi:uncharacterized protein (TIGR03083 family)